MGLFWGDTKAENYLEFTNELSKSNNASCKSADSTNIIGDIKIGNINVSDDCSADLNIGNIKVSKNLSCSFEDVSNYAIKNITDQKSKAEGTGFQFGDISSNNSTDFKTQMNSYLKQRCGDSYDSNIVKDINIGDINCSDSAKLNASTGVIMVDEKTNCVFENLYALKQTTSVKQTAESKQELFGLLLFLLLILLAPVLLPVLGLKSLLKNPFINIEN